MGFLRFFLACIVVLCHTSPVFGYQALRSDLAVQIFFIISGFYMTLVLKEKYPAGKTADFYFNRAIKIYPIYWTIFIPLIIWGIMVNKLGYPGTVWFYQYAAPLSLSAWIYFIFSNVFIVGLETSFLLGIKGGNLYFTNNFGGSKPNVFLFGFNSIAWTVGIELIFYLISPFILRRGIVVPTILLLISLATRIYLSREGMGGHPWDYMFFPTQLMFFMLGCLSYHLYKKMSRLVIKPLYLQLSYVFLMGLISSYSYISGNSYFEQGLLFIVVTLLIPGIFMLTKDNKIDTYLGNLSYPIYISQVLVISVVRMNRFPKLMGFGFTTLILVILFSIILERFVARRAEKLKRI
jgi:peptidoglycan/LPS O-acetylase OafA/YrhL